MSILIFSTISSPNIRNTFDYKNTDKTRLKATTGFIAGRCVPYTLQTSGTRLIIKTLVKHGVRQQRDL